jgi:FtsP/CotA-like multicopper oxidase with cupredoxin domain
VDLNHAAVPCAGAGDKALYPSGTCPGTLNPSGVPESFMDTPVVNGQVYPTITIPAGAYRFQILNAANDRMFNLSLFYAADANGNVCKSTGYLGGFNYAATPTANAPPTDLTTCTEVKMVPATPHALVQTATTPPALPPGEGTADSDDTLPRCAATPALADTGRGDGFLVLANPAAIDYNPNTGLPGLTKACWPSSWPTDGRDGGVPDPASAGPPWVQIGTEGGVLPAPVVIPPTPVGYNYNRRDIVVTNVQEHALFLGPAERADVIVDFSQVPAGSALILYNDSPAPVPGYDVRLDYYTGDPDLTSTGGAPTTQPGYGPNIRTIMQIIVTGGPTTANYMTAATGLAALQTAIPTIFYTTQPHIIVPEPSYNSTVLNGPPPTVGNYARIQNTTGLSYTPVGGTPIVLTDMKPKAIHELFEVDYGKMNSILAAELPLTNYNNQTTIPLAYVDPPSEFVNAGEIQLWKVTHNGVDSHAIHFHLFNVQLINRVGWDGAIRPPDPNELGWKETVRMNPLEDAIVALQPILPPIPFAIPSSNRLLDPSRIEGATNTSSQPGFSNLIAVGGTVTGNAANIANQYLDFGWEYVWHCHLLGHEESDMMRPVVLQVASPASPINLTATLSLTATPTVTLHWNYSLLTTPQPTGFQIFQQIGTGPFLQIGTLNTVLAANTFPVTGLVGGTTYSFKVYAVLGSSLSGASNVVTISFLSPVTNVHTTTLVKGLAVIAWTPPANLTGAAKYQILRATTGSFSVVGTTTNLTTTSFPQAGLTTGTVYHYQVVILNAANQAISPPSATLTFTAP